MSTVYQSNSVPFGSGIVVINAGTYIAEDITLNRPARTVERPDQIGGPNGFAIVSGQETISATIQIATSTTAVPAIGQTFSGVTTDYAGTIGGIWALNSVSETFRIGDYVKASITALKA